MRLYRDVNLALGSHLMCREVNDVHTVANLGDLGGEEGEKWLNQVLGSTCTILNRTSTPPL